MSSFKGEMGMADEYVTIITKMLEDSTLTKKEKIGYLSLLECILEKKEDAKYLEDRSYTINGKTLSEKERVIYELNHLYQSVGDDIASELRQILYAFQKKKGKDYISNAKQKITKLQIQKGIKPTFYTIFEELMQSFQKKEKPSFGK